MTIEEIQRLYIFTNGLKEVLSRNPLWLKDVLQVCVDSLEEYENATKKFRDRIAYDAIRLSATDKHYKKLPLCFTIRSFYILFPIAEIDGHSINETKVYAVLLEKVKEEINLNGIDDFEDWMKNLGNNIYDWFIKYLKPKVI